MFVIFIIVDWNHNLITRTLFVIFIIVDWNHNLITRTLCVCHLHHCGLESQSNYTYSVCLQGRAEVLRGLRNFLNMDRPEHHSIDRLKERGVEKGSGRHSTLQGRERSVLNQTYIGTVSRATLGRLLRDGAERVWAFPSASMPSRAETVD